MYSIILGAGETDPNTKILSAIKVVFSVIVIAHSPEQANNAGLQALSEKNNEMYNKGLKMGGWHGIVSVEIGDEIIENAKKLRRPEQIPQNLDYQIPINYKKPIKPVTKIKEAPSYDFLKKEMKKIKKEIKKKK